MTARGSRDGMDGASLALVHQKPKAPDNPRRTSSIDESPCIPAQLSLQRGTFEQVAHQSGEPIGSILRIEVHSQRCTGPDNGIDGRLLPGDDGDGYCRRSERAGLVQRHAAGDDAGGGG